MSHSFLLVDFENVRDLALSTLSPEWSVRIFVGRSQNSIPFALTAEAQALGERLQWIKIQGDGRNNLDFHLAYYLGTLSADHPSASFFILSRDQGFDALVAHLNEKKIACQRVGAFTELPRPKPTRATPAPKAKPSTAVPKPKPAAPAAKPKQLALALKHHEALPEPLVPAPKPELLLNPEDADLTYVRANLAKIPEKMRPRKRKRLTHQVAALFRGKKKRPAREIAGLVDAFFALGWIAESNNELSYFF